jgi:hypothetical protein
MQWTITPGPWTMRRENHCCWRPMQQARVFAQDLPPLTQRLS